MKRDVRRMPKFWSDFAVRHALICAHRQKTIEEERREIERLWFDDVRAPRGLTSSHNTQLHARTTTTDVTKDGPRSSRKRAVELTGER